MLNNISATGVVSGIFANATVGSLITDNAGNTYLINYADNAGDGILPNDVSLTVVAVPEPGTWAMVLGGVWALAWMTIRRRFRTV